MLHRLELAPNTPIVVELQNYLGLLPRDAVDIGMEVVTSNTLGVPVAGQTVADLILLADEGRQVIQMTPKDSTGEAFNGFSQPWDIRGANKTIIAVTNPSKTNAVGLMLSLHYEGGQYSYPAAMLAPGETRHISVNDIRNQQMPGPLGQTLPKTAGSGQALITVPGPQDRLLAESIVADPTQQVALTSSCTTCGPNAIYYTVNPAGTVDGLVGDQTILTP